MDTSCLVCKHLSGKCSTNNMTNCSTGAPTPAHGSHPEEMTPDTSLLSLPELIPKHRRFALSSGTNILRILIIRIPVLRGMPIQVCLIFGLLGIQIIWVVKCSKMVYAYVVEFMRSGWVGHYADNPR